MNIRYLLCLLAAAALLAGCENFANRIQNNTLLGDVEPRTQVVQASPQATFDAARRAVEQMGYRFTHGGPAQGRLEAISLLSSVDAGETEHQFSLKADLHPTLDGTGTEVSVRMSEIIESDSEHHPGQGTETPLRDTPLYDVFFRSLREALAHPVTK